jgi:hypothetical protein
MGYNARNDEIRDNVTRMRREWEAQRGALATVRRFNAILSANGRPRIIEQARSDIPPELHADFIKTYRRRCCVSV